MYNKIKCNKLANWYNYCKTVCASSWLITEINFVDIINTPFFPRKTCFLWDNVGGKNYGISREIACCNEARYLCSSCRIPKATSTHPEYVIPISCPTQKLLTRTLLNSTLYVYRLVFFCLKWLASYWTEVL